MNDIPDIIHEAGALDFYKLIVIGLFGIIVYYLYQTKRDTKQINNAVNHRTNGTTTMSQDVLEIKDKLLDFKEHTHDNFDKVNHSLEGIHQKIKINTNDISMLKK